MINHTETINNACLDACLPACLPRQTTLVQFLVNYYHRRRIGIGMEWNSLESSWHRNTQEFISENRYLHTYFRLCAFILGFLLLHKDQQCVSTSRNNSLLCVQQGMHLSDYVISTRGEHQDYGNGECGLEKNNI